PAPRRARRPRAGRGAADGGGGVRWSARHALADGQGLLARLSGRAQRAAQSSTWPRTQGPVPPPTQIVPSGSLETCTRPERPRAVPWLATYGTLALPVSSSH